MRLDTVKRWWQDARLVGIKIQRIAVSHRSYSDLIRDAGAAIYYENFAGEGECVHIRMTEKETVRVFADSSMERDGDE